MVQFVSTASVMLASSNIVFRKLQAAIASESAIRVLPGVLIAKFLSAVLLSGRNIGEHVYIQNHLLGAIPVAEKRRREIRRGDAS